jgi:hypothetical protein
VLHGDFRGADRGAAKRHQAHPGLLDAVPARLHGHGGRLRRAGRGDVSPDDARVFQGAAFPRRGFGHSRTARGAGHLAHGRPGAENSADVHHVHDRDAGADRVPALRGIVQQGFRARGGVPLSPGLLLGRRVHGVADRILYDAAAVGGVLRRRTNRRG